MNMSVDTVYAACDGTMDTHGHNFADAVTLVPTEQRRALSAVNPFARRVEDIANGTPSEARAPRGPAREDPLDRAAKPDLREPGARDSSRTSGSRWPLRSAHRSCRSLSGLGRILFLAPQAGLATIVECSRSNKQRDHEVHTAAPDVSDSEASTARAAASMSLRSSQRTIASTIGPVVGLRSHRRRRSAPPTKNGTSPPPREHS
jgi:hypothetical protein